MIPLIPDFVELWVWDRCYAVALDGASPLNGPLQRLIASEVRPSTEER